MTLIYAKKDLLKCKLVENKSHQSYESFSIQIMCEVVSNFECFPSKLVNLKDKNLINVRKRFLYMYFYGWTLRCQWEL